MKLFRLVCVGLLGAVFAAPAVRADDLIVSPTGHRSATGRHAPYPNRQWPGPFPANDRNSVQAAFRAIEDHGWLRAHTLGDHLFDPVSHALTNAGRSRVRAISSQAPSTRRMVFVSTTADLSINQARINQVREFIRLLPTRAGQLQVAEIDADPLEVPALNAEEANRQTRLPPVHNLSPQPLFFGYGAGNAQRE